MSPRASETLTIVIRDIESTAEMRVVEQLQKEVWRLPDLDVVPWSHLVAAKAAGGVLIGAFDGQTMVGFVYGFVGYEHDQPAHHSHMLAVKPEYRNYNLGFKLKLAQRKHVLDQGINIMSWTFDPLQSLNAYFNFRKLGVVASRYLVNFYGEDAPSFLHRNGTDRLWVTWPLKRDLKEDSERLDFKAFDHVRPLVEVGLDESPTCNLLSDSLSHEQALIEIPADIIALQNRDFHLAAIWRDATRWAFTKALDANYMLIDFSRETRSGNQGGTYLLSQSNTIEDYI